ncbi:MAG: hypothetical protein Tp152SUR00d2C52646391_18 [Prokaryotic dsDNA virus sp.]|nr:MAG: hypothetical protein Tp152SUR00d2C52646391_18 [Prokaryotic dsDNA virus sp.]|tara:strand:- start:6680 stop:6931 length:252 start_codon:yes stop_codon:yes gene_type:complete
MNKTTSTLLTKRYVIWNPFKVSEHTSLNPNTLLGLIDAEARTNSSISSVVSTKNITEFINAVYNETDVTLCFATEKEMIKANL